MFVSLNWTTPLVLAALVPTVVQVEKLVELCRA